MRFMKYEKAWYKIIIIYKFDIVVCKIDYYKST